VAHQFSTEGLEPTFHTHPELQPGLRLTDTFSSRIHLNLSHPKKSSEEFPEWLNKLHNFITQLSSNSQTVIGFTDGSAQTGPPDVAAAAFCLYKGNTATASAAFVYSEATSSDVEVFALAACISRGIAACTTDLHIFSDSQAVITTLLSVVPHSAQAISISTATRLRMWFSDNPNAHLHVRWCPCHVGVEQNEIVDCQAREALASPKPIPFKSIAWAR
jgi:ribonuclease HI